MNEIHAKSASSIKLIKSFKIKSANSCKEKRNLSGKQIPIEIFQEISQKKQVLEKLENRHSCSETDEIPKEFNSQYFVQNYLKRFRKLKSFDLKNLSCQHNFLNSAFSEENFFKLISSFYTKKMLKSKELMKYFVGKDTLQIINHIGKYLYNNLFAPIENNLANLEYLENIHKQLNISHQDFNLYKGLFIINMRENGFSETNVQIINIRIEKYRAYVVKQMKIEHLCPFYKANFEAYLLNINDNIRENGILGPCFYNINDQTALLHHRRIFNHICEGYQHYCQMNMKKLQIVKENHCKMGVNWRECFEMKNLYMNNLLNKKTLFQNEDLEIFRQNLQSLHKFILAEPNMYENNEGKFDLNVFFKEFSSLISKSKTLFGNWTLSRIHEHSKYMADYLFKSTSNPYQLEDMVHAHCKVFISGKEFNHMLLAFKTCLIKLNTKQENMTKWSLEFDKTRHYISREQTLLEKIGGLQILGYLIENIYVFLFGSDETKNFFVNSEIEYVKFKQKLFFARILENNIDYVDLIDLKAIHYKMGIKSEDFNLFLKFCKISLLDLRVNDQYIEIFLDKLKALQPYICSD